MSPASYLTAPPRDAVTIVAPVVVWIALALLAVGVVAGIVYAVVRGSRCGARSSGRARRSLPSPSASRRHPHRCRCISTARAHPGRGWPEPPNNSRRRVPGSRCSCRRSARRVTRCAGSSGSCPAPEPDAPAACVGRVPASEYGEYVRVAAVDLGTNTTRLLVADVEHGLVEEVVRREVITHMGESVDRRRILLPTAVARVRNVLVDYRREAEGLGAERVLAVGTSAVRDADNGEAFLGEIEWSYAFTTRLLDGGEEAELMLRGVMSDRTVGESTFVVDIGGGSMILSTAARTLGPHLAG